jgi:hypothetical protein
MKVRGTMRILWGFALLAFACKANNVATVHDDPDTFTVGPSAQNLVGPDSVEVDIPASAVSASTQVTLDVSATFPELPLR